MKLLLVLLPMLFAMLTPVDEARRDASFVAYRDLLTEAVRNRDEAMLVKLVDPKIRTGFGAREARPTFGAACSRARAAKSSPSPVRSRTAGGA